MRNLSEWYDAANTSIEKEKNLHSFNHKRYMDGTLAGSSRGNLLEDAYHRFESHLASKPTAYGDPGDAIYDFAKDEVDNIAAGSVPWQDAAAYSGAETLGVSKFAALKSLDFVKDNMSQIGYRNVIFGDFIRDIDRAYDATSYKLRPANQFKVAAKRKIDAAIKAHLTSPTVPVSPGGTTGARTGSPVGMTTLSSVVPTGFGDSPMWLTTPESIQVDRSTPPPDLPEDVTVRSGYAAGMKEALGLLNGAELKRDQTRMAEVLSRDPSATAPIFEENEAFARFGIVLLLSVDRLPEKPVQPTIFSLGFKNLFVARPANSTGGTPRMDGKTVRLKTRNHHDHGSACSCGRPGLPEAVLPANVVMSADISCEFFTPLFGDDLKFDFPECDMIRSKNA